MTASETPIAAMFGRLHAGSVETGCRIALLTVVELGQHSGSGRDDLFRNQASSKSKPVEYSSSLRVWLEINTNSL